MAFALLELKPVVLAPLKLEPMALKPEPAPQPLESELRKLELEPGPIGLEPFVLEPVALGAPVSGLPPMEFQLRTLELPDPVLSLPSFF